MECVEIVRHLFRKHKEVGEQSGVGRFGGRTGARKERKGVPDDQKLSTNGGFWTLPLYGHQFSLSFILSSNPDHRCVNGIYSISVNR